MKERWTTRWFRKRALLYHLLVLILVPGCLAAGWWQVQRAASGNTLSYLYSIEWPIFAVLAVIGWWQLIHEDPAAVESRKVERARRAVNRGPFVPPPPDADSGFYQPLHRGARGVLDAAGDRDDRLRPAPGQGAGPAGGTLERLGATADAEDQPTVHTLSSYNAYLARLSIGGGRKSWRNPHGLSAAAASAEPGRPVLPAAGPPREAAFDAGRAVLPGQAAAPAVGAVSGGERVRSAAPSGMADHARCAGEKE